MANAARGEVKLEVGGQEVTLCLTLGALAEMESELNIEDVTKIGEVFKKPNANTLLVVLTALIHGGGHTEITREQVAQMPLDMSRVQVALQQAMVLSNPQDTKTSSPKGK